MENTTPEHADEQPIGTQTRVPPDELSDELSGELSDKPDEAPIATRTRVPQRYTVGQNS